MGRKSVLDTTVVPALANLDWRRASAAPAGRWRGRGDDPQAISQTVAPFDRNGDPQPPYGNSRRSTLCASIDLDYSHVGRRRPYAATVRIERGSLGEGTHCSARICHSVAARVGAMSLSRSGSFTMRTRSCARRATRSIAESRTTARTNVRSRAGFALIRATSGFIASATVIRRICEHDPLEVGRTRDGGIEPDHEPA